jgi:hypothetical protein
MPSPARLVLGTMTEISVTPGSYLVRCQLPSGEFMSARAEVKPDADSHVRLRPAHRSPRETLAWAFLLKQIPREVPPPIFIDHAGARLDFNLWEHRGELRWDRFQLNVDVDRSIQDSTPYALAALTLRVPQGQTWLEVHGPLYPPRFIALPPAPLGEPVQVLIVRETVLFQGKGARPKQVPPREMVGEMRDPLTVLVSSQNLQAELLLGYLAAGSLEIARRIGDPLIDDAERVLAGKIDDPSAAAIGGYYLLRAGRVDRLHDWSRNLANFFGWLPDGAVIHAWQLLRQDKPDVEQARARMLEAERRGLPLYTQGLRLLFDGLDLLSRKYREDKELQDALGRVQRYAVAANWRAMTTTFYGQNPSEPQLHPRAG